MLVPAKVKTCSCGVATHCKLMLLLATLLCRRPPADTRIRHKLDTDCVTCTDPPTRHRGVTNYTSPAAGPGVGLGADGQRGDS